MTLNKWFRNSTIWILTRILFSVIILFSISNDLSFSIPSKRLQTVSDANLKENNPANVIDFYRLIPSAKSLKKCFDAEHALSYYGKFSRIILKEYKLKINNEFGSLIKLNCFLISQKATST